MRYIKVVLTSSIILLKYVLHDILNKFKMQKIPFYTRDKRILKFMEKNCYVNILCEIYCDFESKNTNL